MVSGGGAKRFFGRAPKFFIRESTPYTLVHITFLTYLKTKASLRVLTNPALRVSRESGVGRAARSIDCALSQH